MNSVILMFPGYLQVTMIQLCLVLCGLTVGIKGGREFVPLFRRDPKSLTDTFPFNLQEDDKHHGHDVGHHHEHDLDHHQGHDLAIDNDLESGRNERQVKSKTDHLLRKIHSFVCRMLDLPRVFLSLMWHLPMQGGRGDYRIRINIHLRSFASFDKQNH